ncbi:hypothetical protein D3C72_1676380 [compost metagenome]
MRTQARRVHRIQATFIHVAADVFPFGFHFEFADALFSDEDHVGKRKRRVGRVPTDDEVHAGDGIVMDVVPRQHGDAAATGGAVQVHLAGDAVEADEQVAGREGFQAGEAEEVFEVDVGSA